MNAARFRVATGLGNDFRTARRARRRGENSFFVFACF